MASNVISRFIEKVIMDPQKIALRDSTKELTYKELNDLSDTLALKIRQEGIGNGDYVGIEVEKKVETVIGMLAVLKVGAAYLPLDSGYPKERLDFILSDAGCRLILNYSNLFESNHDIVKINISNNQNIYETTYETIDYDLNKDNVAYVIYTSGTTGKPKGVIVEHKSILNLVVDNNYFNEKDIIIGQAGSLAFDAATFEIWGALLNGGQVFILDRDMISDVLKFRSIIINEKINTLFMTVALFNQFISLQEDVFDTVEQLFIGGEAVTEKYVSLLEQRKTVSHFCNIYGPTETTTFALFYPISNRQEVGGKTPIGKPLKNVRVYILKEDYSKCSAEEVGELYIGGEGVARGYLNRDELTKEKFIKAPWNENEVLYKTGDYVKMLDSGDIEFIGRKDNQVKIHGFRIELEEIETAMHEIPGIEQSVVKLFGEGNDKRMCAFFSSVPELNMDSIKKSLFEKLPEYMIPNQFVRVEEFKLTENKKIDRSKLEEPSYEIDEVDTDELNGREKCVALVFSDILGIPINKIGRETNFFEMGGDSIKGIRMVSKLRDAGYEITVSTILDKKTVMLIAAGLHDTNRNNISQEAIVGEVHYTPIQKQFFTKGLKNVNHFNQTVLFVSDVKLDIDVLNMVVRELYVHHDMLRTCFHQDKQVIRGIEEAEVPKVKEVYIENGIRDIDLLSNEYQKMIDIEKGPLASIVVFRDRSEKRDYLFFAIHHLVVDGISWRIIAEDLNEGYRQALDLSNIRFSNKTLSFQAWSDKLLVYGESDELLSELEYWRSVEEIIRVSKIKKDEVDYKYGEVKTLHLTLGEEATKALVNKVSYAYHTEINDILLTGVFRAISKFGKKSNLSVFMEGHGREKIGHYQPIDRTVGWFTTIYPLALEDFDDNVEDNIIAVKEAFRKIPNHGIGYTVLRWHREGCLEGISPDVTFNYLGDFSSERNAGDIKFLYTDYGYQVDRENIFGSNIVIDTVIIEDDLNFKIEYNSLVFDHKEVNTFSKLVVEELKETIEHCLSAKSTRFTLSDFKEDIWTDHELESAIQEYQEAGYGVINIYPLTPLQEGMLFHKINDEGSKAYTVQCELCVIDHLDITRLKEALNLLTDKHPVLRSSIAYKNHSTPRQVILSNRQIECKQIVVNGSSENSVAEILDEDIRRGFDLQEDSLLRITVLRIDDITSKIIMTFHHIIMDGWCISLIMKDLDEIYCQLSQGQIPVHVEAQRFVFGEFARYHMQLNHEESLNYWSNLLSDYEIPAELKNYADIPLLEHENVSGNVVRYLLDKSVYQAIKEICRHEKVTVNTFVEAVWGILLQKYNRSQDVVFGKIVSGRNVDIVEIENAIGLFINTIPIRIKNSKKTSFKKVLKRVQQQAIDSSRYDSCPLYKIQQASSLGGELIKTIVGFENFMEDQDGNKAKFQIKNIKEETNYDINIDIHSRSSLEFLLMYNTQKYSYKRAKLILEHFVTILKQVAVTPEIAIEDINPLDHEEYHLITTRFSMGETQDIGNQSVVELFEETVNKYPSQIAVRYGEDEITYRELNERANYTANKLVDLGLELESTIGIMVEDGIERIIALWGILKAGYAFLPMDPKHPLERLEYIASNSNMKYLISDYSKYAIDNLIILPIMKEGTYKDNLDKRVFLKNLAYIIYTSGTTGVPKGVMIEHKSLLNLCKWQINMGNLSEKTILVSNFHYIFDGFVWEVFPILLTGGILDIYTKEDKSNLSYIVENSANKHMMFVTSMFRTVLEYSIENNLDDKFNQFKKLYIGAEEFSADLIEKYANSKNSHIEDVFNVYGPTECAVCSTAYSLNGQEINSVPIGKPITNYKIFILDDMNICGIGMPGEICISGAGVARGYIHNEELTNKKFTLMPDGSRGYRTGDLGCWDEKGNITFLGRVDDQVKIKGFRIELGEIEKNIRDMEGISDALVAIKKIENEKVIVAYYIADDELAGKIRDRLNQILPGYMVPSHYVQMEAFPKARSGKISKKNLPLPEKKNPFTIFEQTTNSREKLVEDIFREILGSGSIGRNGDFFECGGDSIKAIKMLPKFKEQGYILKLQDILGRKTVKNIAKAMIENVDENVDNSEVVGESILSPIQKEFIEKSKDAPHYFNFSVLLEANVKIESAVLEKVLHELVFHHDELRAVFKDNCQIVKRHTDINGPILSTVDISDLDEDAIEAGMEPYIKEVQESFNIEKGLLFKGILFHTIKGDFLFLCAHHLVVDGVSWRIIAEDLEKAYLQMLENGEVQLPNKTNSFISWCVNLTQYAKRENVKEEAEYWRQIESQINGSQFHVPTYGSDKYKLTRISKKVGKKVTNSLLYQSCKKYGSEINDLLLTALIRSVHKITNQEKLCINLEAHGRESIDDSVTVDRTVGWFTSMYPIILSFFHDISENIVHVKELIRRIPKKGIGYLLFVDKGESTPQLAFNYLGEFDLMNKKSGVFKDSQLSHGQDVPADAPFASDISLDCYVKQGKFFIEITYKEPLYDKNYMNQLLERFHESLLEVVEHCCAGGEIVLSASDYGEYEWSKNEFDSFIEKKNKKQWNVDRVYSLTPLQEGMLYHKIASEDGNEYFVQGFKRTGLMVEDSYFRKAVRILSDYHQILKTAIVYRGVSIPRQAIVKNRYPECEFMETDKDIVVIKEEDMKRGFDLEDDCLVRFKIFHAENSDDILYVSFHHIIMDGWCLPIMEDTLWHIYHKLLAGNTEKQIIGSLPELTTYEDYIHYMQEKNKHQALKYWEELLEDYGNIAKISLKEAASSEKREVIHVQKNLMASTTNKVRNICKMYGVTMNSFVETCIGVLLQKYCNYKDVIFGKVVSGRNQNIDHIQEMIGLFINTIPVRIRRGNSFIDTVLNTQQQSMDSSNFDYCSLSDIQNLTKCGSELIHVLLAYENYTEEETINKWQKVREDTNYPLTISVIEGSKLEFDIYYDARFFESEQITRLFHYLTDIIESAIENPFIDPSDIACIARDEREQLIRVSKQIADNNSKGFLLQEFKKVVKKYHEKVAIKTRYSSLTYAELDRLTNVLALKIIKMNHLKDSFIGILADKNIETVLGILAILKSGAGYIPIDRNYPEKRIKHMIEHSGTSILLYSNSCDVDCEKLIEIDLEELKTNTEHPFVYYENMEMPAYLIYTSGSTGTPKGVVINRSNVVNLVKKQNYANFDDIKLLQTASFSFDASTFEIWGSLLNGGMLYLADEDMISDVKLIKQVIKDHEINTMFVTTALFNQLLEVDESVFNDLRQLYFGGEATTESYVRKLCRQKNSLTIYNMYGPTEATTYATYYEIMKENPRLKTPIGRAINNYAVYIMQDNTLVGTDMIGELCIEGNGLSSGYLNHDEISSKKFVTNPYTGSRMYRTGDLCKQLADGNFVYVGRIDNQVKVHGFRMEFGEIESKMKQIESVKDALSLLHGEGNEKEICMYYVSDLELRVEDIKKSLSSWLPNYMIPQYYMRLKEFPVNVNGKIDREALPKPSYLEEEYEAPIGEMEKIVTGAYISVLGNQKIGRRNNFFEKGGHSLKAIKLLNILLDKTQYKVSIKEIFDHPTVSELAKLIEMKKMSGLEELSVSDEYDLLPETVEEIM